MYRSPRRGYTRLRPAAADLAAVVGLVYASSGLPHSQSKISKISKISKKFQKISKKIEVCFNSSNPPSALNFQYFSKKIISQCSTRRDLCKKQIFDQFGQPSFLTIFAPFGPTLAHFQLQNSPKCSKPARISTQTPSHCILRPKQYQKPHHKHHNRPKTH